MSGTPISRRSILRGATALAAAAGLPALVACESPPAPAPAAPTEPPLGLTFPSSFQVGAATRTRSRRRDGGRPGAVDLGHVQPHPGRVAGGDTGDVAADHYHRYREDLDLMKALGLQSYRFSVSWSRVIPDGTGPVNPAGLDFYKRLVDGLRERDIEPMVTLFHWDLPQALQDRGGWVNRDCAQWFAEYAEVMFTGLGDAVPTWLTLNEPKTVVNVGYRWGGHAPGIRDDDQAYLAAHHLLLAHGLAVQALRRRLAVTDRAGPEPRPRVPGPGRRPGGAVRRPAGRRVREPPLPRPGAHGHYPQDVLDDIEAGSPAAIRTATWPSSPRRSTCWRSSTTTRCS